MASISNAEQEVMQRRSKQLTQISEAISPLESSQSSSQSDQEKLESLNNASEGMYDEIDKLTKKKPIEEATEIMVEEVNNIISKTQRLITDDSYIKRLKVFVPAGNPPELRDVLFVLRLARQGMEHFGKKLNKEKQEINTLLLEAKAIKIALELFQQNYSNGDYYSSYKIETDDIEKLLGTAVPDGWTIRKSVDSIFSFERLDYIEIEDYFKLS